jgi:pimeloyl-ACP methyl ester carboxylesterase
MLRAFGDCLFGEQTSSAPPRVLGLPGWMRSRSDLLAVVDGLDAIVVDLPGFGGASPPPPTSSGAAGYADLVTPALEACAARVVVLGHSFGGRVAVHLAARHPEQVTALVLTGVPRLVAPEHQARPARSVRLARWLHRHHLLSDTRMELIRQRRGSTDYRNATGVMRDVLVTVVNEDYGDVLPAITCPVELVWGDDDTAAPLADVERARPRFGGPTKLTVIPGAGHLTPLTAPSALRAALDAHLP